MSGIEPPTSSLPRRCSTTELQQLVKSAVCFILKNCTFVYTKSPMKYRDFQKKLNRIRRFFLFCPLIRLFNNFTFPFTIERKTGLTSTLLSMNFSPLLFNLLSERRVSNPQPPAWKAGALPIELLSLNLASMRQPLLACGDRRIRTSEARATDLQSVPFGHSGISPN